MQHSAEMRRCLLECDVAQMRKLDQHLMPHLSQLTDDEVLITIHLARTSSERIPLKLRAWSHRWLLDNGLPSKLPDHLKSKAERLYPRIVDAVGIAVNSSNDALKPVVGMVHKAMSNAVLECYADNRKEPEFVKARMMEAKHKTILNLLGGYP
jgi:hypothetical protein